MQKLSVMTWNTQLYEQGNNVGERQKAIDMEIFMSIVKVIQYQLEKENSIVFAQEIPYCSNITWREHELYTRINEIFPEKEYNVIWNMTSKNQIMMTVAIAKKGIINRDKNGFNDNRCVSIKNDILDINIMGIHAKAGDIPNYLSDIKKRFPSYFDIILGDFNAGNYLKDKEDITFKANRKSYLDFMEGYIDVCQGKETTQYFSQIDHILVKNDKKNSKIYRRLNYAIKIIDTIKISDHYPIVFDAEIYN